MLFAGSILIYLWIIRGTLVEHLTIVNLIWPVTPFVVLPWGLIVICAVSEKHKPLLLSVTAATILTLILLGAYIGITTHNVLR